MSVTSVSGFGKEKDELQPEVEELTDFTPKVKIEIVCRDDEAEKNDCLGITLGDNNRDSFAFK